MESENWKIESLKTKLREIHPTFLDIIITDELEMTFSDGDSMQTCEFIRNSETRNILEELEELLIENDDE